MLPFVLEEDRTDSTLNSTKSLENELETYVHGGNSSLHKLVSLGDIQGLGRFTNAIGKTLDSAKRQSTEASLPVDVKLERKHKREKVSCIFLNVYCSFITKLTNLKECPQKPGAINVTFSHSS